MGSRPLPAYSVNNQSLVQPIAVIDERAITSGSKSTQHTSSMRRITVEDSSWEVLMTCNPTLLYTLRTRCFSL